MTVETLEHVYGHMHPDHQQNAVNALSRRQAMPRQVSNVVKIAGG